MRHGAGSPDGRGGAGGDAFRFGAEGPWLFGVRSIADAFYTPVAARVRHFQLDLAAHGDDGAARTYMEALLAHAHFREWETDALA